MVEKRIDSPGLKQELILTREELNFIAKNGGKSLYVGGMLSIVRKTGKTLKDVYKKTISEPGNEEHILAFTEARDFLVQHSEKFGLKISPDEPV